MHKTLAAFGLVSIIAGCGAPATTVYTDHNEALAAVKAVDGGSVADCQAIGYNDGETVVYAYVVGFDGDGDGLAMQPDDPANIYGLVSGYSQYMCVLEGMPPSFILVGTDEEVGADCDDHDPEVGTAATTVYVDSDGDGLGTGDGIAQCGVEPGYSTVAGDCNDGDPLIGAATVWFHDWDNDGYGDAAMSTEACEAPEDHVANNTDCDDGDAAIYPDAVETCNESDDDCDGNVDEEAVDVASWYSDGDSDGYGDPALEIVTCDEVAPEGYVGNDDDCDVGDGTVNPGAVEVCDEVDNDCDGSTNEDDVCVDPDPDADGDTYPASVDCNDVDAAVHPGAVDVDNDGLDNNCDGTATDQFCATANTTAFNWQLMLSDYTVYAWTPDDPMWLTGYGIGNGEICTEFDFVAGHTLKINGGFDMDLDGLYGEDPGDYWLYMTSVVNASSVYLMGMDVTSGVVNTSWGGGTDGILVIPALPTSL